MRIIKIEKYLLLISLAVALFYGSGCAVDNDFLAKMPLFEARSDKIPGLTPPPERKKQIRQKGEKGVKAEEAQKEILVAQLMVEYRTSPDPNMRREAVDAMARIPHAKRDEYMREILNDADPFVRISALEAIGKTYSGSKRELATIFIEHMKRDPDKDVRLTAVRLLADSLPWQGKKNEAAISSEVRDMTVAALGEALYDKVSAIRYEAMQALHKTTGKDYGTNIDRWIQYVRHVKGEVSESPKERALAEKLPRVQLPMFK